MGAQYDKAKAAALKILGDKGKVPDMPDAIGTAQESVDKAFGEFDKSREACEAKLLAVQNACDSLGNAGKQFLAKIEKSDFELDSSNKDDLKKIQKARPILTGMLDAAVKNCAHMGKMLDEVDKHLIQLGKYKPKPGLT